MTNRDGRFVVQKAPPDTEWHTTTLAHHVPESMYGQPYPRFFGAAPFSRRRRKQLGGARFAVGVFYGGFEFRAQVSLFSRSFRRKKEDFLGSVVPYVVEFLFGSVSPSAKFCVGCFSKQALFQF